MNKLRRLVVTCGGTGGHFYPGLSIAREFRDAGGEVKLLLSGVNSAAQSRIAAQNGISSVVLPLMPSWKKPFAFARGLCGGVVEAGKMLRDFRPDALLGMGSFASLPAVWSAWRLKIPFFLHDGNARIGRANRILSYRAKFLGAGFPPVNAAACRCRIVDCGMPVRPELKAASGLDKAAATGALRERFGVELDFELPTILIFGGSQGAAIFNAVLPAALSGLGRGGFQVLHLAGRGKMEAARQAYGNTKFPLLLLESDEKMQYFLAAADLVFGRSGGSSIAELALFGKPAVLVPYPYAAEGHQQDNAAFFTGSGAGISVGNADFTPACATELAVDFLDHPDVWRQRGRQAAALARPDAAMTLLTAIDKTI